ncbi:MAG: hypothetical protein LC104_01980 [Bacteroidales bacterium]|nr:hypothetical protein [Bacteroidales bacterium]
MRNSHIRLSRVMLLLLGCGLVGCSGKAFDTHPVTGLVTVNGKPLASGSVTFVSTSGGPPATGEIGPDGRYTLTTEKPNDGAAPGKYTVMIIALPDMTNRAPEDRNPLPAPLVPEKYLSTSTSGLTAEVKAGENSIDFPLVGDVSGKKPQR